MSRAYSTGNRRRGPSAAAQQSTWRASQWDLAHEQQPVYGQASYGQERSLGSWAHQPAVSPNITSPADYDAEWADKQILGLLINAPSAFADEDQENFQPFLTAYTQTLLDPDPRKRIFKPLYENTTSFAKDCIESWYAALMPPEQIETISRIVWNINEVISHRWPQLAFVVEPFGSVSWRGQTEAGDLDLVLRDYKRPLGYTSEYWGLGGLSNPRLPAMYNTNQIAKELRNNGYLEVNPIRWASTPIGESRMGCTDEPGHAQHVSVFQSNSKMPNLVFLWI